MDEALKPVPLTPEDRDWLLQCGPIFERHGVNRHTLCQLADGITSVRIVAHWDAFVVENDSFEGDVALLGIDSDRVARPISDWLSAYLWTPEEDDANFGDWVVKDHEYPDRVDWDGLEYDGVNYADTHE